MSSRPRDSLYYSSGTNTIVAAIGVDAKALSLRGGVEKLVTRRGLQISICAGVLMGLFFPVGYTRNARRAGFRPYSVTLVFAIGVGLCALLLNTLVHETPITGEAPVSFTRFSSRQPESICSAYLEGQCGAVARC